MSTLFRNYLNKEKNANHFDFHRKFNNIPHLYFMLLTDVKHFIIQEIYFVNIVTLKYLSAFNI